MRLATTVLFGCAALLLVATARGDEAPTADGWVRPATHEAPATPDQPPSGDEPKATEAPAAPADPFAKRLMRLEVTLSRRVAEQPALWRFEDVQRDAAELLTAAGDDAQRAAVRDLSQRAARFAELADRYRSLTANAPRPRTAITPPAAPVGPRAVAAGSGRYDAIGELRPVVSKRPGAPKYALVADDGQVVTFLSPAPGLDLDPLLGKRVGARGGRGYMPEYRRRHLTAQQVQPVDTVLR